MLLVFDASDVRRGHRLDAGAGSVMAIEKNMPWGRRLSAPLGLVLLGWGLSLVAMSWDGAPVLDIIPGSVGLAG